MTDMFYAYVAGLEEYSKWDLSVRKAAESQRSQKVLYWKEQERKAHWKQTGILLKTSFQDIDFKIC